jgi:hypothetical protein
LENGGSNDRLSSCAHMFEGLPVRRKENGLAGFVPTVVRNDVPRPGGGEGGGGEARFER